jgi:hypothetical protein
MYVDSLSSFPHNTSKEVNKMCQTIGKCFIEDPLAKIKDAIWESRRFVEMNPDADFQKLEAHLKARGALIPLATLKAVITDALTYLKKEGRGPARQQAYQKILALLPAN